MSETEQCMVEGGKLGDVLWILTGYVMAIKFKG